MCDSRPLGEPPQAPPKGMWLHSKLESDSFVFMPSQHFVHC